MLTSLWKHKDPALEYYGTSYGTSAPYPYLLGDLDETRHSKKGQQGRVFSMGAGLHTENAAISATEP